MNRKYLRRQVQEFCETCGNLDESIECNDCSAKKLTKSGNRLLVIMYTSFFYMPATAFTVATFSDLKIINWNIHPLIFIAGWAITWAALVAFCLKKGHDKLDAAHILSLEK